MLFDLILELHIFQFLNTNYCSYVPLCETCLFKHFYTLDWVKRPVEDRE